MGNTNMHKAKREKNDEFYTQMVDIEKELQHYQNKFIDKIVYCNCDNPTQSNFWRYFLINFEKLGLKKLISTHFNAEGTSYKLEAALEEGFLISEKTNLVGNGDFRSPECVELLREADVVVTNPPFSLFREYVAQLMEYGKHFLVIGNMNAITYKEIFPLIRANRLWLGFDHPKVFIQPDGLTKSFGNINWFTNLEHQKRHEKLTLMQSYYKNQDNYQKYDNYNAIDVGKVKDIPGDYYGIMGVPITFLDKYNPEQFEIVKFRKGDDDKDLNIGGKCPYFRILVKHKRPA